jgi:hypothetical protein
MSPSLIIDIETGPLADDRLMELWSSPPLPEAPAEFQPLRIRLKSRGDEKETEERIERARCAHLRKLDQHRRECQRIQDESFQELRTKAALSALTGEVLAIGYGMSGSIRIECQDSQRGVTERDLLISFWQVATKVRHSQGKILGFNSLGFDIPFLIQRSWMHSVDVPRWVRDGRYFDRAFIDLLEVWKCGTYRSEIPQKLDSIVRAMGLGGKPEGTCGADFARRFHSPNPVDREEAIRYLRNDIEITTKLAERLGLVMTSQDAELLRR